MCAAEIVWTGALHTQLFVLAHIFLHTNHHRARLINWLQSFPLIFGLVTFLSRLDNFARFHFVPWYVVCFSVCFDIDTFSVKSLLVTLILIFYYATETATRGSTSWNSVWRT
jgi:hypothetical protein